MRASFHSLLIQILALWKGLLKKQVASRAGFTPQDVSDLLKQEKMDQEDYERLLGAVRGTPVEVALVTGCLEALDALGRDDAREAERERIELAVLEAQRIIRNDLTEAARRSRKAPSFDGYPKPDEVEPARWQAREVWPLLQDHSEPMQQVLVRHCRQFQT
ncbi:MAG TPA: hypothetical protein VH394_08405, partial [Thermoanaerobaculia bacterium]|nr:hypothetical protein [Thermoanaerobaculia bacterium]